MAEPDFTRIGSADPANAPLVELTVRQDSYLVKINDVYLKILVKPAGAEDPQVEEPDTRIGAEGDRNIADTFTRIGPDVA